MIIDAHVHIGKILNFDLSINTVLEAMDKYHIDFSLISNLEGGEVDHQQNLLEEAKKYSQILINQKALNTVKKNPQRLGLLIWCRPLLETADDALEEFIINNRKYIYGLKFHPFHSNVSFSDERIVPYVELAKKYNLPILIHTANDYNSSVIRVYEMALKYPSVNFICAHLGLCTDHKEAIDYVSKLPNLYGDTAWLLKEDLQDAIKKCGKDKIIFGTDMPIDGVDTYRKYEDYLANDLEITQEEYENLMYKNARKVYKIK